MAHAPGERQTGHTAVQRVGSGAGRIRRAWRSLPPERRLAAIASVGLFVSLFLPWYQETVVAVGRSVSATVTGWQAFSFVEAAVLVVAAGVLTLLFQRAEGRAFHIPGGDGGAITAAGVWAVVLVLWRIFDKQSVHVSGPGTAVSGVEWGIFLALATALLLAYAGSRVRAAHAAEPPLPGEEALAPAAEAGPRAGVERLSERPPRSRPEPPLERRADPPPSERPTYPRPGERPAHQPPSERPAYPRPSERPRGWLSAKPKQRLSDEQLTIPLEDREN